MPGKPAARVTDQTTHGSPLFPGPGSPDTLIGMLPAWRTNIDQHACPATSISGSDGVGAVIVGALTVLINQQMACRILDVVVEKPGSVMGPANPILKGCPTVLIGDTPWADAPTPGAGMGMAATGLGAGVGEATQASLLAAMTAAAQAATPAATAQSLALEAAAGEGTALVEHCPYADE
jgi:uncharacterized Zn-binding protein involved in type VI secretion